MRYLILVPIRTLYSLLKACHRPLPWTEWLVALADSEIGNRMYSSYLAINILLYSRKKNCE